MPKKICHKVLFPVNVNTAFDYYYESELPIGTFVKCNFRNKEKIGMVWQHGDFESPISKVKKISHPCENCTPLCNELLQLIAWTADYYMAPLGNVLKMSMSANLVFADQKRRLVEKKPSLVKKKGGFALNIEQKNAVKTLTGKLNNGYSCSLINGVTGSGKTEVYFELIEQLLQDKQAQICIMLPEISLSVDWLKRFESRFGFAPQVWHSMVTPAQKRNTWLDVSNGDCQVVVGARSSLFLPFKNLKLIVIDEEHDQSYKQEDGVVYNARDMAVVRGSIEKIPVVLASATPSIETVINVQSGKYDEVILSKRVGEAVLPEVGVIDMREEKLGADFFLSDKLKTEIQSTLEQGQQAMLFLNRRGFAPLVLCRKCGYRYQDPSSSAWLVMHKHKDGKIWLQSHHSDYKIELPKHCDNCQAEDSLHPCGPGVQRCLEEVKEAFPQAKAEIISSDDISTTKQLSELIERIKNKEIDIIIGTQILAKGHNFPSLALVGVVDADLGLDGGDPRAFERSFQLLHQVAGRAGRKQHKGKVLLQSFNPENRIIKQLVACDREGFIKTEVQNRIEYALPPFSKVAILTFSGQDVRQVKLFASQFYNAAPSSEGVRLLGPAEAQHFMLRGRYRIQIMIKAQKNINIQAYIRVWVKKLAMPSMLQMKIDIDPYSYI